jgi:hypothetical protein
MKPARKHPRNALSPVKIRALSRPGRYADGSGLYLVVDPSGAKRWMLRTLVHGRRRDIGLGGVQLVPLLEARAKLWLGNTERIGVKLRALVFSASEPEATNISLKDFRIHHGHPRPAGPELNNVSNLELVGHFATLGFRDNVSEA